MISTPYSSVNLSELLQWQSQASQYIDSSSSPSSPLLYFASTRVIIMALYLCSCLETSLKIVLKKNDFKNSS